MSLYIDQELGRRTQREFEQHRDSCSACKAGLEHYALQLDHVGRALHSLAVDAPAAGNLEDRVIAKIREERGSLIPGFRLRPDQRSLRTLAAAFALTTLAAVALFQGLLSAPGKPAPEIISGKRLAFTIRPTRDGRVDAAYSARRYARIQAPESGWKR
jgi:anti-sigma factor RsiW